MVGIHGASLVLRERLDDLVKMQRLLVHCVVVFQGSVVALAMAVILVVSMATVSVVVTMTMIVRV